MGPDGDGDYDALLPAAEYNAAANEYLLAWGQGRDVGLPLGKTEIFARSMAAPDPPTGQPPGSTPDTSLDGAAIDLARS